MRLESEILFEHERRGSISLSPSIRKEAKAEELERFHVVSSHNIHGDKNCVQPRTGAMMARFLLDDMTPRSKTAFVNHLHKCPSCAVFFYYYSSMRMVFRSTAK